MSHHIVLPSEWLGNPSAAEYPGALKHKFVPPGSMYVVTVVSGHLFSVHSSELTVFGRDGARPWDIVQLASL